MNINGPDETCSPVAHMYLRISEDREGDELGIDRHREDLQKLAAARGWHIAKEHVDNDLTATGKRDRPGFNDLVQAVERGKVTVVMAWMLDRLLRNRRDQVRLFEACEQHGVTLAFARGSDIDMSTPAGQMVADFLAAAARGEIKIKGDRQRRAQAQAAVQGRRVGGRKRFGYQLDGMAVIEEEAAAIRKAYDDLITGVPLGQIARDWNSSGLRSGQRHYRDGKRGGKKGELTVWTHDTVRLVLLNPAYAGLRRYKGEVVGKAQWPAIVPEDTFRAVEALLKHPGRRRPATGGQALLTGVALCGVDGCDSTVHAGGGETGRRNYRTYRCAATMGHISRKAEPIEQLVSNMVLARLSRKDARNLLIDDQRPDVGELRKQAQALRSRIRSARLEFADDDTMSPADLREIIERLKARLLAIETEMADAGRVDLLSPLVHAQDVESTWIDLQTARQRMVVDALMTVRIKPVGRGVRTFRPESVEIDWNR